MILLIAGLLSDLPDVIQSAVARGWLWAGLALAISGLVLVEQVARNTRSGREWQFKFVWLALGALFTFDLCLYSISLLGADLNLTLWTVRGVVNVLLGALLLVGVRRVTVWQSETFLSPRVVFFNATLLAMAVYVFAMAAASYFIRVLGGSLGAVAQAGFLFGAVLVLVVAALSAQFRAWARVMIAKHLLPYQYDYRVEWQKLTRALSEDGPETPYDRIARVLAGYVHAPSAGLWLRDTTGTYAPVGGQLAPASAPHEAGASPFFTHLREREWICDLEELRAGKTREPLPEAPEWLRSDGRCWLVVPLVCRDELVGFVVVTQPVTPVRLSWEELDLLKSAGRQVASFLAFEQAAKRLAEAHQFEAVSRLTAVLMHDLRHLIAQQALVVENAQKHKRNPEFVDDAILTIENSVKRMTQLMDELRSGVLSEQAHRVDLGDLCHEVTQRLASRQPQPALEAAERGIEVIVPRERLLHVLEHLVRNAQDATPPEGSVRLRLWRAARKAVIEVADTGCGMDETFLRTRLFRPFETTKGAQGFGIGAYEAREFIRKCNGNIEVKSTPGQGTTFTITLPLAAALSAEAGTVQRHERAAS